MTRPPRRRSEHLLNSATGKRVAFVFFPLEAWRRWQLSCSCTRLADWRPWEVLAGTGVVYREATTMTMAAIMTAQIGGATAWRTDQESLRAVGLFSNRLLLGGMAVEIAVIALLS